ncbi:hypothetical protein [Nocardioides sp. TF02-7]|uniref:hypothetical protein n=1 Tax=Nocardioides sp. TF02-7 TaxID=2917724 RepID=UPI001F06B499|nr:hypothetical protein [Nocardioides sp. TF02-7]UMG92885.1 hypothetical protein MF408_00370 [Nocardioides sp. TF02-7]
MAGKHSHKRETARRKPRAALLAGPLAIAATGAAVTAGVLGAEPAQDLLASDSTAAAGSIAGADTSTERRLPVSRGGARPIREQQQIRPLTAVEKALQSPAVARAVDRADTRLWTTAALNVWTRPDDKAEQVGEIAEGEKVLVTGREVAGREEVVVDGQSRWVTAGYLTAEKPFTLGGDCTNGTSVPAGVSPNIKAVHEAVCAEFPEISTYGTFRSDGEHGQGIAVDIMVSGDRGWQVAEFIRKYYSELGVSYLIYAQQIWSVERSSEGWRAMEDRGSATANHYDHVHVTTY